MTKTLKPGITIDTHVPAYGFAIGETIYTVCDAIGVIFTTTNPALLERFYVETLSVALADAQMVNDRLREALRALLACPSGEYCDAYPAAYKLAQEALKA